jgi:myo-inositol 2-dehydrogenase/D-chiro-inositol 1-dehydrogenase
MTNDANSQVNRRTFMNTTAAAAGLLILKPQTVRGSSANSAIRLGLLGCGGRGTGVATSFATHTAARVVALADLFADQLEKGRKHFDEFAEKKGYAGIDPKLMFKGPKAYEELVASKEIDMVQISTPGYFHTEHLEAAVAAGKHVYCEKPVGVDVHNAKRAMRIGEKAAGRLSLDIGFQIRSAPPFVAMVERIHAGALGKIACGAAHYHATSIELPPHPNASPLELRIRNWYWDRILSGDIIVDQNIHVIDICNWVLQGHPVKAVATGGRKVRTDSGNCWDHFDVNFYYPDDVHISFNSVQFGNKLWDVSERFFGSRGVAESPYSGPIRIYGEEPWEWNANAGAQPAQTGGGKFSVTGEFHDNLEYADREKDKAFIESITSGKFHNQAALGAESALSAILARTAAYSGTEMTWDELLRSDQTYDPGIDLNKLA